MRDWRPLGPISVNRRQLVTGCMNGEEPLRLPLECANCLAASTQVARCAAAEPSGSALLIPYCSRCYRCLEAGKTRVTLVVCASVLFGVCALLLVPLSGWDIAVWGYAAVTLVAAGFPLLLGWTFRPRHEQGQTSSDIAVWWHKNALLGTNAQWIERLVDVNQGVLSTERGRAPLWTWPTLSAALLLSVLALAVHQLFYPSIAVLNLSAGEFVFLVDGRSKATVGVSSLESPHAMRRVNVPVGRHRLEARLTAENELLQGADVNIDALGRYLFAPAATGYCFWTESAAYGKSPSETLKRPLGGKDGLFVLPAHIDTWFAPNPPPNSDTRSSGGEMVALRHGRCAD